MSKASKKAAHRSNRSLNGAKGGRPRKDGERTESGRLRDPGPNPRMLAQRRELLGSGANEKLDHNDPLDVALARGWLTQERHQVANSLCGMFRRAGTHLPAGIKVADYGEATLRREVAEQITGGSVSYVPVSDLDGDPEAWAKVKLALNAMRPAQRARVISVVLRREWPQWLSRRIFGRPYDAQEIVDLEDGLDVVAWAMRPARATLNAAA